MANVPSCQTTSEWQPKCVRLSGLDLECVHVFLWIQEKTPHKKASVEKNPQEKNPQMFPVEKNPHPVLGPVEKTHRKQLRVFFLRCFFHRGFFVRVFFRLPRWCILYATKKFNFTLVRTFWYGISYMVIKRRHNNLVSVLC